METKRRQHWQKRTSSSRSGHLVAGRPINLSPDRARGCSSPRDDSTVRRCRDLTARSRRGGSVLLLKLMTEEATAINPAEQWRADNTFISSVNGRTVGLGSTGCAPSAAKLLKLRRRIVLRRVSFLLFSTGRRRNEAQCTYPCFPVFMLFLFTVCEPHTKRVACFRLQRHINHSLTQVTLLLYHVHV